MWFQMMFERCFFVFFLIWGKDLAEGLMQPLSGTEQHDPSTYDHEHRPSRHLRSQSSRWPWSTAAGRCSHLHNLHLFLLSAEPPCDCHTCNTERHGGISDLQTSFIQFYCFFVLFMFTKYYSIVFYLLLYYNVIVWPHSCSSKKHFEMY